MIKTVKAKGKGTHCGSIGTKAKEAGNQYSLIGATGKRERKSRTAMGLPTVVLIGSKGPKSIGTLAVEESRPVMNKMSEEEKAKLIAEGLKIVYG